MGGPRSWTGGCTQPCLAAPPPQVREGAQAQGLHWQHPRDVPAQLGLQGPCRAAGAGVGASSTMSLPHHGALCVRVSVSVCAPSPCSLFIHLSGPRHALPPPRTYTPDGHRLVLHRQAGAACGARKGRGRGRHSGLLHPQGAPLGKGPAACQGTGGSGREARTPHTCMGRRRGWHCRLPPRLWRSRPRLALLPTRLSSTLRRWRMWSALSPTTLDLTSWVRTRCGTRTRSR